MVDSSVQGGLTKTAMKITGTKANRRRVIRNLRKDHFLFLGSIIVGHVVARAS